MPYTPRITGLHKEAQQTLLLLGLSEKEIAVYLSALTSLPSPPSVLGKQAGISRAMTQYVCRQLEKKGLLSVRRRKNAYVYAAEPPEKLSHLLRVQQQDLQKRDNELQKIMGFLKGMMNPGSVLPNIQFYEGPEGLISLYEEILAMRSPIDSFEEAGKIFAFIPEYAESFPKKRVALGIPNRCIAPKGSPMNVTDSRMLLEVRTLDPALYPFTWQVRLCKDLVGIFTFDQHTAVGIGIRHAEVARNFHLLFEYVWASLADQAGNP